MDEQWGMIDLFRLVLEQKCNCLSRLLPGSIQNEQTHEIIRNNLDQSPMFAGVIQGIGPRYCPSIEDKNHPFCRKIKAQTFWNQRLKYIVNLSSKGFQPASPKTFQYQFFKTIPGLENVEMIRPGYAVEYHDFVETKPVVSYLGTRLIKIYFSRPNKQHQWL